MTKLLSDEDVFGASSTSGLLSDDDVFGASSTSGLLSDDDVFGASSTSGLLSDDDVFGAKPKAERVAVPEATIGSAAQDIASGVLQIAPTAIKGVADIARLATGDRIGAGLSNRMESDIKTIQKDYGSERSIAQRENFNRDMADDSVGIGAALMNNKGALADQVLPTVGSMFLPVGVAGAAGKLATVGKTVQGMDKATVAARVLAVQKAAGIGTVAAQNASDTFAELVDKGTSMEDAYLAAGITVPFSIVAGKLTDGGAEMAIARAVTGSGAAKLGAKNFIKAAGQEGAQEAGEELGQITGEAVGTKQAPTLTAAGKRMAVAGTLGSVMGGGVNAAGQVAAMSGNQEAELPVDPAATPAADILGLPAATEAEKALYQPRNITALDRVQEIAQELPTADPERAAELQAEHQTLTQDWPTFTPGVTSTFSTEAGARIEAQYALAEAGDLITSHDENLRPNARYPQELQPRQRDRAASEMQVSSIVQKLDPARLGESADAANGAPIVGADGLVESGNARTIALKRVYQANGQKADSYRQFLADNSDRFGITTESVQAMKNPVLVRVRNTPVDRAEFARQANSSTVAQMSPSEQAKSDAARIDDMSDLLPDDAGDFSNAGSRGFVSRFMSRLPGTEQSGLIDGNGGLSQTGYARIRNAVLAKAYGDSPVLLRMVESMDDNLRNVSKALMAVAPDVAKSRQSIAEGALHDVDITADLMAAVAELSRLKDAGRSVKDALAQQGMFGGMTEEAMELLAFLDDNLRRPKQMAEFVRRYFEALAAAGNPNQGSLLGETAAPSKGDLLTAANRDSHGATSSTEDASGRQSAGNEGARAETEGQPQDAAGGQGRDKRNAAAAVQDSWVAFPPETGTLGIPRAEMPQIKGDARGALVNFLKARGIENATEEVAADTLMPTQAEFSIKKTEGWKDVAPGGDRSVLASSDGYILDGHHQWVAALAAKDPIKVIRFDAPMQKLLAEVYQFPSAKRSSGATTAGESRARTDFDAAMADLGAVLRNRVGNTAMIKEEDYPDLLPTLTKLFGAAFRIVGYDMKKAAAHVRAELKNNPTLKKIANFIKRETMDKAAQEALANPVDVPAIQDDLFAAKPAANPGAQMDMFSAMAAAAPEVFVPKAAMIDGRPYDQKRDNYASQDEAQFIGNEVLAKAKKLIDSFFEAGSEPAAQISAEDREKANDILRPLLKLAEEAKVGFDQKIIDIAKRTGAVGQMLAAVKGIRRASEKLVTDNKFDSSKMRDLLRSIIVVNYYDDAKSVLDEIGKEFTIQRVKNKTNLELNTKNAIVEKSPDGYMDVLVNVTMPNGTLAEIQINIPAMMAAKMGSGHKLYEISRAAQEGPEKSESESVQRELYAAALLASTEVDKNSSSVSLDQLNGHHLVGSKDPVNSLSTNRLPSGNSTYDNSTPSLSVKSNPNTQPSGNLSGTFISSTSTDSIADAANASYTYDNGKNNGVANEQHGNDSQTSAQGQEPGAVQQPAGERETQRVRAGTGRGNQRPDSNPDRGTVGQWEKAGKKPGRVSGSNENGGIDGDGNRPVRNAGIPAGRDIPAKSGRNYRFGDGDLTYAGGWQAKARQNIEAVELLKKLTEEGRQATSDEQAVLAKFIGWGSSEMANSIFGDKLTKTLAAIASYEQILADIDRLGRPIHKGGRWRGDYADSSYYQAASLLREAGKIGQHEYPVQIPREQIEAIKPDMGAKKWGELRDRLKQAMTADEWKEASRSTQYAHYTSKPVVNAMMSAISKMGFKGGTILEPGAGIGVFPGLMPADMATNSVYTGVEFDTVTGGILKQLFPDERILVESFVDSKLPENFYDVAFGNPPFGAFKILGDPKYAKNAFVLHDYFFAKTLDSVKPGGLVVFVTSRYTMDKKDDKARSYMAERADLVGAIRLPQTAFQKNAGTEVVTDVLFLRKKVPGAPFAQAQPWSGLGEVQTEKDAALVNEYFAAHPEMVLGIHSRKGSMYGKDEYNVLAKGDDIEAQFAKAANNLPADVFVDGRGSAAEAARVRDMDFNPKSKKEGSFYVTDAGVLMQREGGVGVRAEEKNQKNAEVLKDYIALRDAVKQAQFDQLNDGNWEGSLQALQKAYAAFTKKNGPLFQHTTYMQKVKVDELDDEGVPTGNKIEDEEQRRRFPLLAKLRDDPEWTLAAALESFNEDTGEILPSDWLTKRTLGAPVAADIQTPTDALLASLDDTGTVDIPAIAERIGLSDQEAIDALGSLIYEDPTQGWIMGDEYLSGNVKKKLAAAEEAAKSDKRYARNVEALKAAQPASKVAEDITPQIGMNWIPGKVYEQFLKELTGVTAKIEYVERTREWALTATDGTGTLKATNDWGAGDKAHAGWLMDKVLTGSRISLNKSVSDGKGGSKQVFDPDRTEAANQKAKALREEFRNWIWKDAARADSLVQLYNDKFNTTVQRKFDGRHLSLPGTSQLFNIFDHVKRGAWRVIQTGNTYLAHAVGSGKTFEMVISAMEQKRLGRIKKPMVIVPGHMLQQFASEWQQLYPTAKLMVADEKDFHTDNRRKFVSRVAMSDLDGVIMTHSSFGLLDLDPAFKQGMIEQELEFLRASYEEAGGDLDDIGNKKMRKEPKIKRIEAQIEKLEQQLAKAMSGEGKDKNVRFDEMGVDFLYVDEAHLFRKLSYATNRQMKGIDPNGSQMAWDLYMKTRWLAQKNPTRFLAMASGTPITNTTAELYTVQRFMAPQVLEELGLQAFDDWASQFGEEGTEIEATSSGKYEPVTRFSKFVNVGEMTQMFRDFADVLNEDHLAALLGDKRPKVAGGARKSVITPKTESYATFQKDVLESRIQDSKNWKPSFEEPYNPDPIIAINTDARLASIDMRFMDPKLPNDPDSKLNHLIDGVIRIYQETKDNEYKDKKGNVEPLKGAAQMVFFESGFGRQVAINRGFNARAWLEKRLRDAGIPIEQVAFMEDYKKSSAKLKLFKDVNSGKVRVLVGSSAAMGTGVNAQQRLIALHHLDAPMVPAILEQREGRIVRQGNKNPLVQIYAYSMRGSFDENQWGMLARKKFFIEQALSGDPNIRSIEDVGEVSQLEMAAALVAENPFVLQLAGVRAEVEKLSRLQRNHEDQRARMADEYRWAGDTIALNEKRLPEAEKEAAKVKDLSGDNFTAKADGKTFTARKEWGAAVMEQFKDLSDHLTEGTRQVGELSGFAINYVGGMVAGQYRASVLIDTPEPAALAHDATTDPVGLALRAVNALVSVTRKPADMKRIMQEAKDKRSALEARLYAPFPLAETLADKIIEAGVIEKQMLDYGNQKTGLEREQELEDAWQQKTGAITPLFSRGNGSGMALRDLKAVVSRVSKAFKNLPTIHVLESPEQAPESLREFIRKAGAWDDAEGAMHDGEIYLFASGLADEARAEHVLAVHEVTHYGLRGAVGKDLDAALQHIWLNNAKVRKAATQLRERNGLKSNVEAVEEILADMKTADLANLTGWKKVVQAVRNWLAKVGATGLANRLDGWMKSGMDEQQQADLYVADLVNAARDWVKNGKGSPFMEDTRLADGKLSDDIAEQEKWLTREAKARGYKDIEDLLERNYPAFEKLAELWRKKHPADALLSRASSSQTANQTAAQRADDLIAKKAGTWRPVDAVMKMATDVAGISRLTSAIYRQASALIDRYTPEEIKAGVIADYGVPEAVIDRRVAMQGRMRGQIRGAGELIDKLSTLTRAESRVAYEWMNNSDPQAVAYFEGQLPAESVRVMQEVKDLIDKLSQEAVSLGQLDPDTFKKNRFEYLRRSYVKHTAELTKADTASRQRSIAVLGDQYKGRGMTDAIDMAKFKNVAPEWWGRKLQDGKADKGLKGERFIRLERRAPVGEGVAPLEQAQGPGETNRQKKGRLMEVAYWPADEALPAKYSTWDQAGTWEARDTKGGKVVVWRDFTKQERMAMGEIDEARYAIAKTLHGMIHDVETGRYLEWLANSQAAAIGATLDGPVVDASERMRDTFVPGTWAQVPETKTQGTSVLKYGKLAGRYIPGPVWNDVRQTVGFRFQPLGETFAAIMSAWKTSKTALSPAVHTNNVMANFVMADWHDVSAGHIAKALRIILGASQRDGKGLLGMTGNAVSRAGLADREAAREVINRFEDSGANMGSWVVSELQKSQLEPLLAAMEKELGIAGNSPAAQVGVMVALQKALQLRFPSAWDAFKPTVAGRAVTTEAGNLLALYEAEDTVFRLAAWLKAKEEGAPDQVAGKAARRSFLDYHINAPWIQAMRGTAFPFISFTYRAVPMMLNVAANKPHKLMKLALLAGALNAIGYMLSGGDEDDERKLLPEEKAGKIWGMVPKMLRMPWNDNNGSPVFLDIRRYVPVGDIFDLGQTHSAVPVLPFAVPGGPLAVLAELATNKSQFTGKAITLETDTAAEKAAKVGDHLYKAFAPNIPVLPGTYAWTGIANASKGKTDSFGRELSTSQAAASAFGVKLGSYPNDVLQLNAKRARKSKLMEIDRGITQLKREYQKQGIDSAEFHEKFDAQIAKKREVVDEFQKKMSGGK